MTQFLWLTHACVSPSTFTMTLAFQGFQPGLGSNQPYSHDNLFEVVPVCSAALSIGGGSSSSWSSSLGVKGSGSQFMSPCASLLLGLEVFELGSFSSTVSLPSAERQLLNNTEGEGAHRGVFLSSGAAGSSQFLERHVNQLYGSGHGGRLSSSSHHLFSVPLGRVQAHLHLQ